MFDAYALGGASSEFKHSATLQPSNRRDEREASGARETIVVVVMTSKRFSL